MRDDVMSEINTDIIRRAQAGDAETISILYEQYYRSVFRYLYYRVGDRELAEDLTSEVFIRMLRFIGGFNPPAGSFQAWLFQIARNLSTDHFRKASSQPVLPLEDEGHTLVSNNGDQMERMMTSESLKQALDRLNETQREVIILRFIAEMPINEVAETLNKSEDAIKGLQRRALIALRQVLQDGEISYG
jgi:RNA polymerase sigma-70 factor, ECF subfamily